MTPPPPTSRRGPGGGELVRLVAGTAGLLVGVAGAVIGAVVVPFVATYLLTPIVTGWQDPGPDIVQGCATNVMCSEPGPFLFIWAVTFIAYVVSALLVFRWALDKIAPEQLPPSRG